MFASNSFEVLRILQPKCKFVKNCLSAKSSAAHSMQKHRIVMPKYIKRNEMTSKTICVRKDIETYDVWLHVRISIIHWIKWYLLMSPHPPLQNIFALFSSVHVQLFMSLWWRGIFKPRNSKANNKKNNQWREQSVLRLFSVKVEKWPQSISALFW